jgi:hypothetical protein
MSHVYYRGDGRNISVLQNSGFQPRTGQKRSTADAINYIKQLIIKEGFKSLGDMGSYIIASSKGDSVSASCVLEGASYGQNKYEITCTDDPIYYTFNKDGSVGAKLSNQGDMYGRKPYYILNHTNVALSDYVIVGTRTNTQEATFFTDIPSSWISLIGTDYLGYQLT